ncbi:MAG: aminotransferase class IV [Gemmatimonadales bacterium]|nr:aminotransferase class IV [Gemmatimonadales bacterium]
MAGLFETIRIREGRVPFLAEHLARLGAGLWRLGVEGAPPGLEQRLRQFEAEGEVVVRVTIDETGEVITERPVPAAVPMRVVTSTVPHDAYPVKSTVRAQFERAREEAEGRGAEEALLLTAGGHLAEGAITSLFFWSDELLCTPDLGLGILPGIGRARVMTLARRAGIPVAEGRFAPAALLPGAPFLVNAVRGIVETLSLDDVEVRRDPRTAALRAEFWG